MSKLNKRLRKVFQVGGYDIYRSGEAWRRIEAEQLQRFFHRFEVDCVFDVGANEGQYATALRDLGFAGTILSFEPVPEAAATIRRAAAGDPRWEVFETALDAEVRQTEFNVMAGSQFSSLKTPLHVDIDDIAAQNVVSRRLSVRTATLNEQVPALKGRHGFRRPFLKMDTQGNDLNVVRGASDVLSGFVGLQSELSLKPIYQNMPGFAESLDFYRGRGFELSALVPNNAGHFPDLVEVDCIMYNTEMRPTR